MQLIKREESEELFVIQEAIIGDENMAIVEKKCRIAILSTFLPIEDYHLAYDILDEQRDANDFASNLIGAYIGAYWIFDKPNIMLDMLLSTIEYYGKKEQAEIKYVEAIHKWCRNENYIEDIIESIALCDNVCAPYYLLLDDNNYCLMEKEELINVILSNTLFREYCMNEVIEPQNYIEEKICRNITSEESMYYYLSEIMKEDVKNIKKYINNKLKTIS